MAVNQAETGRVLSKDEVHMVQTVFGNAVDCEKVRIFYRPYLPFHLQLDNTAITPNGNIYFKSAKADSDFAAASQAHKHWFMHEMVHVWQYQLGYPVLCKGLLLHVLSCGGMFYNPYAYRLQPLSSFSPSAARPLHSFNMEQQADIIADYFALQNGYNGISLSAVKHIEQYGLQAYQHMLQSTLAPFCADAQNLALLPS